MIKRKGRQIGLVGLLVVALVWGTLWLAQGMEAEGETAVGGVAPLDTLTTPGVPLCRFGVNALESPTLTDLAALRVGWYMDFGTQNDPELPNGIQYMPQVRLHPATGGSGYTYTPNGNTLLTAVSHQPGAHWLISNEPDSIWQDNLLPDVYARAYHELYYLIKNADPTAKIIPGSIVQATPLRLQYLDMILSSYYAQFQEPFPSDGWSIHNYVLNEVSCDYDPLNCWGADVPPGIDQGYGEIWGLRDNDRVDIFIQRVVRFRQWLAARGYTGQPVYLSEYSVLMPADYADEDGNTFPPSRVNAFMAATYDYMRTATDPVLGDPNDGYRLVQQWAWFSTTSTVYNGTLFNGDFTRTEIGDFFAGYTAVLPNEIDLYPHSVTVSPPLPFSQGEPVTVTVQAHIANSGNLAQPTTNVLVRFYDGHPQQGGQQVGADQVVTLAGCGDWTVVTAVWPNLLPGTYQAFVTVDPIGSIAETNEGNNTASGIILVPTQSIFLPILSRAINW